MPISTDRLLLQKQIYNFLRSATIKYEPIAHYINNDLAKRGYAVNDLDPTTWKYYLNMQGLYHVSDTEMYITSLDTQELILFSKDAWTDHPRTKLSYIPGGIYYDRLCKTYPTQVDLIKSILFPVEDVAKAITSSDLTLLGYGSGYLEDYEEQPLVEALETFLEIIVERWYFDFLDDEPYFYLTFWGTLWTHLAAFLAVERESYINTPYVHSYHIWSELKAQGLDDYSDILDRKKSMMLYQNIDYLKANAGKMSNLIILANRLLSDFGVSIYGRRVVQEAETGASAYQLTPQLQAVRIPTDNANIVAEISSETVRTIQTRVYSKGLTDDNSAEDAAVKERILGDTTRNEFMTKFLEIRPIAKNKVYADTLNMFLLETLMTSILNDYYKEPLLVNDISTGVTLYLYPRQLLALYHYAVQKSLGLTPVNIPNQFRFYKSFTTTLGTPTKTIIRGDEEIYLKTHVNPAEYLADLHYNTSMEDPEDFTIMLTRQWLRYMAHLLDDQSTKIERRRYILDYLSSLCHSRRVEEHQLIAGYTSYENWLGVNGIDIANSVLAQYDVQANPALAWENLADSIITGLVPMNDTLTFFGNFTLSDFGYERLRQLFVQMCSYRVVFLESSRDMPKFAIGAKWSSRYGPDTFYTYSDKGILRRQNTKDTATLRQDINLHAGFCKHEDTKVTQEVDYSVTTTSDVVKTSMSQPRERFKIVTRSKGVFRSRGTLNLCYSGMIPEGITTDSPYPYLIDADRTPIVDADMKYIVDPDANQP